ncbi:hypothetical protein BU26DRAFT_186394 [Trematosphaeria pertusa]|uniref:Uncharacterized protein n=1 Tax=Trematosphaeria pertusa TaxID=390896 RepID=A0A6A6HSE4_9PLEO|nr:uncharacterized protein BU26DRAFT_186394 [Trematosphaeria pertusa]KAF2241036.1 hypothetical protein BU26DRAFT_186394 [Trematosphaeria pertusa]
MACVSRARRSHLCSCGTKCSRHVPQQTPRGCNTSALLVSNFRSHTSPRRLRRAAQSCTFRFSATCRGDRRPATHDHTVPFHSIPADLMSQTPEFASCSPATKSTYPTVPQSFYARRSQRISIDSSVQY